MSLGLIILIIFIVGIAIGIYFFWKQNKKPTPQPEPKPDPVPVVGVVLNKSTLELEIGETETLVATIQPVNADNKEVIWRSDNTGVATVDGSGVVKAISEGSTSISVTTVEGSKVARCQVTVKKPFIEVTGISLSKSEIELGERDSETLVATVTPSNATDPTVTWSSGNTNVATVDGNGKITAVGEGDTTIIARAGNCTSSCLVNVYPVPSVENSFENIVKTFSDFLGLDGKTKTLDYLKAGYQECESQFYRGRSLKPGIPYFYDQTIYPIIYDFYGSNIDRDKSFRELVGFLFSMILSELKPTKRTEIYKLGYELAGKDPFYPKKEFKSDFNVSRLVASGIYVTSRVADLIPELRTEIGGEMLTIKNSKKEIYVDLPEFLSPAPGPYLSSYNWNDRKGPNPYGCKSDCAFPGGYPDGEARDDHNFDEDWNIYEYVTKTYNLTDLDGPESEIRTRTIEAIADKEGNFRHIFGPEREIKNGKHGTYTIYPVFGLKTIGIEIPLDSKICEFLMPISDIASSARQALLGPNYGRRRPGEGENDGSAKPKKEDRVLVDYEIENNDGEPAEYYDKNGNYVVGDNIPEKDYYDYWIKQLWANSYPSGHSSYIWNLGLALSEVMPDRADRIMRAAYEFSVNRTIARYHWNSDIIQGRTVGAIINPVLHATTDYKYDKRLKAAQEEYASMKA